MIQIDKNVPMPKHRRGGGTKMYPWEQMEVGDSFFAPMKPVNMGGSKAYAMRRTGFKFALRDALEDGVKGCRIWRVA